LLVRKGLYPFIIAFFFAYLLNPAVKWVTNRGVPRGLAIAIVYIVVFGMLLVCGSSLIPVVIRELEGFGQELPQMTIKGEEMLQTLQLQYQNSALPLSLRTAMDDSLISLQGQAQIFITRLVDAILTILSHFIGLAISPVLAFYLLYDWPKLDNSILELIPAGWRNHTILIAKEIDGVLAGVIRGQLTVAVVVGILVSVGLSVLGLRYALIIGIFAGILDLIPYFGAFIGAVPAVTVALLDSPLLAMKVAGMFLVIHQLEGTIIGPKIIGDNIGLPPLAVIFFLFVGEELAGVLGMIIGVPLAAVGKVIIRHLLKALI
jgi:predicted PurR-regulated permease PerM